MLLLQHGAQNSFLESKSAVYDLPLYSAATITRNKKCAASILTHLANKSVYQARRMEREFIKTHKQGIFTMRQSIDGAYPNVARYNSKFCYMFLVSQAVKMVTDYDILCILKQGGNIEGFGSKQQLAQKMLPSSLMSYSTLSKF